MPMHNTKPLMKPNPPKAFYSKVLLFGEHIVNIGARGLAIPYPKYKGILKFFDIGEGGESEEAKSNKALSELATYLRTLLQQKKLPLPIAVDTFEKDIGKGLFFDSNIPQGYGMGSSGALIAALYARYGEAPAIPNDAAKIADLKTRFGILESHYHGTSSGFDPLICFINQALLIKSKTETLITALPDLANYNKRNGAILFLINTHIPRSTDTFVNRFMEQCQQPDFENRCRTELLPQNDGCIAALLESDAQKLLHYAHKLSEFQALHMDFMIPHILRHAWQHGLQSNEFYLKVCGAGGGGFMMGIAPASNTELIINYFGARHIEVVGGIGGI